MKNNAAGNDLPELPEDPEARLELARQFAGLIWEYADQAERHCRSIVNTVPKLLELLK